MNKTIATYKAYLKDLHTHVKEYTVIDDRKYDQWTAANFQLLFSTTWHQQTARQSYLGYDGRPQLTLHA